MAGTWRGPRSGSFSSIVWSTRNRARREAAYPDRPKFTAAEPADWTRIFKRVDLEHPTPGKNSFQAPVGREVIGRDLVSRTVVYFVAYTKDHGIIEVISIRFADNHERAICFR